jgi:hypothetical protein
LIDVHSYLKDVPEALKPIWTVAEPNASLQLYDGKITVNQREESHFGSGQLFLRWHPTCQLRFESRLIDSPPLHPDFDDIRIACEDLPGKPQSQGFIDRIVDTLSAQKRVSGKIRELEVGNGNQIVKLVFHLPNFPHLRAGPICLHATGASWTGRHVLLADGWKVTLDALSDCDLRKNLKQQAGSGITHVGQIERCDCLTFGVADAQELINCLFWFFSFCKAHWTGPILFAGFDKHDNRVYERFSGTRVTPERSRRKWLCDLEAGCLEDLFPGFVKRWNNPEWGDAIKTCLYWYVDSNLPDRSAEGAIVELCALFEALGWVQLVETGSCDPKRFEKLGASHKLKRLLVACGIDHALPHQLRSLKNAAAQFNKHVKNGPDAIMTLRNAYTHPGPESRALINATESSTEYVLLLARHYASLCLLRAFDYHGTFLNYFSGEQWEGAMAQHVPWSRSAAPK